MGKKFSNDDEPQDEKSLPSNMLPSPHRLPAIEVNTVLRNGHRISSDTLQLSWKPNDANVFRCAAVVGVKVSKKAVERNRVKRLIRESIHHALSSLSSGDAVFVARKGLVGKSQIEVEAIVRELLAKAGALSFE